MATSDPSSFHTQLQLGMEQILSAAAKLADSENTRDYHQHSLISQCSGVKERLQTLLAALKRIGGDGGDGVEGEEDWERVISECVTDVGEKIVELRKEVCWNISVGKMLISTLSLLSPSLPPSLSSLPLSPPSLSPSSYAVQWWTMSLMALWMWPPLCPSCVRLLNRETGMWWRRGQKCLWSMPNSWKR